MVRRRLGYLRGNLKLLLLWPALAMLVGNANNISLSLFAPANTLAALLALNFPEAGPNEIEVLMYAALVLMLITLIVNIFGSMIMMYAQRGNK